MKKRVQHVSVVIPTYNGKHLLAQHLPSVVSCLQDGDQIVIVDDHSTDATVSWLVKKYALTASAKQTHVAAFDVHTGSMQKGKKKITFSVVANHENIRFGQAVNRGVEVATHDLLLILNNDVIPDKKILSHLLPHFENERVFAVGCLEKEPQADGSEILGGKNRLWFEKGMFIHSRSSNFDSGPTAWVSGGSGMFDRQKWLQLHGFDIAYYPAYWEDIDLSFRAKQRNWLVLFEQNAIVEHRHETTNDAVFGQQQIRQMSWKHGQTFVLKNGTLVQKLLHIIWQPFWWWQLSKKK
jgi:GT2 family glycosyltransferase